MQPEHQRTTLRGHDGEVGRLGNDRTVGNVASQDRRQRAGASVLFRDRALHNDVSSGSEARLLECSNRIQIGDDTALHVASAAAIQAPVNKIPAKRGVAPNLWIADFNSVDVPIQNQRAPATATSTDSHDIRPVGETSSERNRLRMVLQRRDARLPDVHVEVVTAHQSRNRLLRLTLAAGLAWDAHELLQRGNDFRSQRIDHGSNSLLDVSCLVHMTHVSDAGCAGSRRTPTAA